MTNISSSFNVVAVAAFPVISEDVKATVPVASGKVIVLSGVGSVTVKVVSCAFAVAFKCQC